MSGSWNTFFHYIWWPTALREPIIWHGLLATIVIAVLAQVLATILGVIGALCRLSNKVALRAVVKVYITYFRGTPVLVQLSLIYFGISAIGIYQFPDINVFGLTITGWLQASVLGLGLNEGAYMTEVVRAGIMSVDAGQTEAAKAIGMNSRTVFRWVIMPQAARIILPTLGNEFNGMIKNTSLCVVIGGAELFNAFEQINGSLFLPFQLFLAASVWYLELTLIWDFIQRRIERRLGRGHVRVAEERRSLRRYLRDPSQRGLT